MMSEPPPAYEKIPPGALPRSEADGLAWLRLIRSRRIGPATFIRLLREFGDAPAALAALPRIAAEAGARGYAACTPDAAEAEWRAASACGARPLFLGAADYPPLLALLSDPPPLLWALGRPEIAAAGAPVALVGARNASALGCRMARRLARELGAAGLAVASGLARGIDAAAHEAALATGTVAVQPGGVDVVYPAENAPLAAAIAESGLRLSEMPMGEPPKANHFLRRNRIISGLSLAVVVVEAAERSGALNTARNALDQGREVMAVPGHPLDPRAGGCNLLIREGAALVRSAADVLELLPTAGEHAAAPAAAQPAPMQRPASREPPPLPAPHSARASGAAPGTSAALADRILALLGAAPVAEDALIRETAASAPEVAAALLDLELTGAVQRHPGSLVSRSAA